MSTSLIEFKCSKCRDGYRLILRPAPTKTNRARQAYYLAANSNRFDWHSPFDSFPALFARFVDAPSREGLRQFADNFGLPSSDPDGNTTEQKVYDILREQDAMKQALVILETGDNQKLIEFLHKGNKAAGMLLPLHMPGTSGLARLGLRLGLEGKLESVIVPSNLTQAMWIQFLLHAASEAHLFRCEQCQKPFVVGSGTKRRRTAKYCSNACKVAAFKARQEA
jgi:hypothetical protein